MVAGVFLGFLDEIKDISWLFGLVALFELFGRVYCVLISGKLVWFEIGKWEIYDSAVVLSWGSIGC